MISAAADVMHEPPAEQVRLFLCWFVEGGVRAFDIQLRTPSPLNPDEWMWLTRQHQGIDAARVLKLWPWLRHMNAHGADVFFRPAREGLHPVLFLDDLPASEARRVAQKYGAAVIRTSPDNTQVWMRTTHPLNRQERTHAQKHLSSLGWSDPGSISGDHLGRLCGLVSQKRRCWVNALFFSCAPPCPVESWATTPPSKNCARPRASSILQSPGQSMSEREFGWTMGMLRYGWKVEDIERRLFSAACARNKPDAKSYANRTVSRASEILRFGNG
jgi:hypothetical protein